MKNNKNIQNFKSDTSGEILPAAAPLSQAIRETLNNIRLNHRVSYAEIGRLAGVTQPTAVSALRLHRPIRDTNALGFLKVVEKFNAGTLKFEKGKGVEKQ